MTTGMATQIDIDVDSDDGDVAISFRWNYAHYAIGISTARSDGSAALGMKNADARELHRKLGEALNGQDFADAGHLAPEKVQEAADWARERLQDPYDDGDCLMGVGRAHYTTECPPVEARVER